MRDRILFPAGKHPLRIRPDTADANDATTIDHNSTSHTGSKSNNARTDGEGIQSKEDVQSLKTITVAASPKFKVFEHFKSNHTRRFPCQETHYTGRQRHSDKTDQ
jgi:hypothetical protein